MIGLEILSIVILSWLGVELLFYWAPLLGVLATQRTKVDDVDVIPAKAGTQNIDDINFCILTACRDGAVCIPGFVKAFASQHYPASQVRLYLVADNCTDDTAPAARALGMNVYERRDLATAGKGNAISEVLLRKLQFEPFDALLVLDIDARVDDGFLRRAAAYLEAGRPCAVTGATFAKNPETSLFTHTGTMIQALLRLHQEGRAALGLDAVLYGSHGYLLSRKALERLGWRTTTGQIAEDMELRLRCTLGGIPIHYGWNLAVFNDVTADAREAHQQRRRWNSTYLPLIPHYLGPLGKKMIRGDFKAFDTLFGLLILPSFANLFLYLAFSTIILGFLSWRDPAFKGLAAASGLLWLADIGYFLTAFASMHIPLGPREWKGFAAHLWIRLLALFESVFFVRVKDWPPAQHGED